MHRDDANQWARKSSNASRNIAPVPEPADLIRRRAAFASLLTFCAYFPERFYLPWSDDHLEVIAKIQAVIEAGGEYPLAMPRGSGKTALCEVACLWSVLTGRRPFVMLLAATRKHALETIGAVKTELESNELLAADFPEVCYPIARLEGITNRCRGQHIDGASTHIGWKVDEIVLPTVAGSLASGAIFRVSGITGSGVRGPKFTRRDGRTIRPSLVILDDPQTDQSSANAVQCDKRESIVNGAVLGMAGPGQSISLVCPCTVIKPGDLSDRLLKRWNARRFKLLYSFPSNTALWEKYGEIRSDELLNDPESKLPLATEFYGANREAMDDGARPGWQERRLPHELSAIQHAMNLWLKDKYAFAAEYQNEPLAPEKEGDQLRAEDIALRHNGFPHGVVPLWATKLTAGIDVQQKLLYYVVSAWADDFTGAVIDYGAYPDQQRRYWTLSDAQRSLARAAPGAGLEGSIHAGLVKLAAEILGREWKREDGAGFRVGRCLIDTGWAASADVVGQWCRTGDYATVAMPSRGRYLGAKSKPWSAYQKQDGGQLGFHWLIPPFKGKRATRHVEVDTNFWKSFVAERLRLAVPSKGALSLFGRKGHADHRLIADHLCSEYFTRVTAHDRTVDEWSWRPERLDNHLWDALVLAACGAAMLGSTLPSGGDPGRAPGKKRVSFAEMQRKAKEKRR